jgi:hypothetical protein
MSDSASFFTPNCFNTLARSTDDIRLHRVVGYTARLFLDRLDHLAIVEVFDSSNPDPLPI